jgi:hypothetical protein
MCYLVSSMPPPASTGLRTTQIEIFEHPQSVEGEQLDRSPLDQARSRAEALLLAGYTNVRLWKAVDAPTLAQTVIWPQLDAQPPRYS